MFRLQLAIKEHQLSELGNNAVSAEEQDLH
jgi:hypothetical protein